VNPISWGYYTTKDSISDVLCRGRYFCGGAPSLWFSVVVLSPEIPFHIFLWKIFLSFHPSLEDPISWGTILCKIPLLGFFPMILCGVVLLGSFYSIPLKV